MTWLTHYAAPNLSLWQGRKDSPPASCFFQVIKPCHLSEKFSLSVHHAEQRKSRHAFAFLGFQCDEGVKRNQGRPGAKDGPNAIREALGKLPLPFPDVTCYDAGNIICNFHNLEGAHKALAHAVHLLLKHQLTPIILGGGHDLAFGHYQGINQTYPTQQLGMINFDAHFDMRPLLPNNQGTSGTAYLQIAHSQAAQRKKFAYYCMGIQLASNTPALFATAQEYEVQYLLAEDLLKPQQKKCTHFLTRLLNDNDIIYASICLDVFAQAYAPGVSAPQPLGLIPWQVIPFLRKIAKSGKVIAYDIAELSPPFDVDQRTAKLASYLIYELITHHQS